jgi:hypothetical protein
MQHRVRASTVRSTSAAVRDNADCDLNAVKAVVAHLNSPVGKVSLSQLKVYPLLLTQRINRMRATFKARAAASPCFRSTNVGLGSWLCENAKALNRDRRSYSFNTVLVAQSASGLNLEIELKNIILRRVSIFEFLHSQGHSRRGRGNVGYAVESGSWVLPGVPWVLRCRCRPKFQHIRNLTNRPCITGT